MTTFTFDTAEVAATPALDCGKWNITVPPEKADEYAKALFVLGFRDVEVSDG